jgi:ribonucleoside-diphosphate reductase beta chain
MVFTSSSVGFCRSTQRLDQDKAEEAFAAKKVINGRKSMTFNLLPLKYQWAYDLYRIMKANHWEPEDIQMQKDVEQWRSNEITQNERWIIMMGIGYFSAPPRASWATTSSM